MEKEYLIDVDSLKPLTLREVKVKIEEVAGLRMETCRVYDLVFNKEEAIYSGNGVYIFKTDNEIVYVGNCFARNFVERIPAHFDIRTSGWFHSLLKNILKKKGRTTSNISLEEAARWAFNNCSLILINFSLPNYNKDNIKMLENILIQVLCPYNKRNSRVNKFDLNSILNTHLV